MTHLPASHQIKVYNPLSTIWKSKFSDNQEFVTHLWCNVTLLHLAANPDMSGVVTIHSLPIFLIWCEQLIHFTAEKLTHYEVLPRHAGEIYIFNGLCVMLPLKS